MAYARSIAVIACLAAFVTLISRATADGEICDGEFKEPVRSLKEVENLSTEGCPEFFVKAHRNLIKLLDKDEPVCTMDKANKITNYYDEYLSLEAEQANGGAKLPRDFIKFVVAYGMLVGNKCKQSLLDDGFFHKATAHLDATDFEVMQPWTRDNGMIDHVLRFFPYALYAFPLPSYLTPIHPGFANDLKLALEKQASGGSTESLALVSETCKKRFRPVYEKVALPIAHLDRHGFIQQFSGDQLFHTGAVHQTSLWQRIVFLCELLIDQDQEPSSASNLINRPKVQFEPTKVHLDVYIANPPPSWLDRTITKEQRLAGLLGEKFLLLNSEYSDKETDQVMRKVLESVKKIIDEKNAQLQVLLDRKKEKEAAAAAEAAAHSLRGKLKKCFRGSKTAE